MPAIIESKSKVRYSSNKPVVTKVSTNTSSSGISLDVAELKDMVKALLLDKKSQNQAPTTVKAVKENCVVENEPKSTKDTMIPTNNRSTEDVHPQVVQSKSLIRTTEPVNSPTIEPVTSPAWPISTQAKSNAFFVWNKLSLPDLTPTCMTLELADRLISCPVRVAEDVYAKVGSFYFSADFVAVDFDADPRVPLILGRYFLKTESALIDVFEGELTLHVGKEAITLILDQTSRYSANYNDMKEKQIDVIDMACEEYSHEVLGFSDIIASGNPTSYYDPIVSTTSLTLTPFENIDFLLEEVNAFLAIEDDPTSLKVDQSYLDPKGIHSLFPLQNSFPASIRFNEPPPRWDRNQQRSGSVFGAVAGENCPKCGHPVDGHYCQGCALLQKKFKEDLFTTGIVHGILQESSKPSIDNTNVVNTLREPFIVNHDPGKKSSQSPPQINHHCCYGCGDPLEANLVHDSPNVFNPPSQLPFYAFKFYGNDARYGHYCTPQVPFLYPESCCNQDIEFS
uniref:Reverse transcriptase domain-containing protein n=1 Tax=Tanacetum cinerariifolium TaxID=118510 RepID=A0A6L2MUU9_TANCI|nr:reverse transcriptase domain-containing protein [Tanacetum cinerariifolium]